MAPTKHFYLVPVSFFDTDKLLSNALKLLTQSEKIKASAMRRSALLLNNYLKAFANKYGYFRVTIIIRRRLLSWRKCVFSRKWHVSRPFTGRKGNDDRFEM